MTRKIGKSRNRQFSQSVSSIGNRTSFSASGERKQKPKHQELISRGYPGVPPCRASLSCGARCRDDRSWSRSWRILQTRGSFRRIWWCWRHRWSRISCGLDSEYVSFWSGGVLNWWLGRTYSTSTCVYQSCHPAAFRNHTAAWPSIEGP